MVLARWCGRGERLCCSVGFEMMRETCIGFAVLAFYASRLFVRNLVFSCAILCRSFYFISLKLSAYS